MKTKKINKKTNTNINMTKYPKLKKNYLYIKCKKIYKIIKLKHLINI